jgi:glycerol-3-phosphate cytidylyltransferase-like family protein
MVPRMPLVSGLDPCPQRDHHTARRFAVAVGFGALLAADVIVVGTADLVVAKMGTPVVLSSTRQRQLQNCQTIFDVVSTERRKQTEEAV